MWTGWPTFPMVFVNGTLVVGAREQQALIESDELKKMLAGDGGDHGSEGATVRVAAGAKNDFLCHHGKKAPFKRLVEYTPAAVRLN